MNTFELKIMGVPTKTLQLEKGSTIQSAKELLGLEGNYTVNLNGKPATMETVIPEPLEQENGTLKYAFIVLSPSVKGAMAKKATKPVAKPTKKPAKKK